jgi:hypothetical protein
MKMDEKERAKDTFEIKKTARGFDLIEFEDHYGEIITIQKSSLASGDAIWFGPKDSNPKIMKSQAEAHGIKLVEGEEVSGWTEYPLPSEVIINTRAHLTRKQVKQLLPILKRFVKTGEILE